MTEIALRVLARAPVVVCFILAVVARRSGCDARSVAWALAALAVFDAARLFQLPGWADAGAWLCFPGVSATFAWFAWRRPPVDVRPEVARAWSVVEAALPSVGVAVVFVGYAAFVLAVPRGLFSCYPFLWSKAMRAPYLASPILSLAAWATCHEGAGWPSNLPARIASILGWSACLDVAFGAMAREDLPWWIANACSCSTFALVAGCIMWDLYVIRRSRWPSKRSTYGA